MIRKYAAIDGGTSTDAQGEVRAVVSVTQNKDQQGDCIVAGAWRRVVDDFKRSGRGAKVCWSHDWTTLIGRTIALEEWEPGDSRLPTDLLSKGYGALVATGRLNLQTQKGRETWELLRSGDVDEFSVGFDLDKDLSTKDQFEYDSRTNTRFIKGISPLYEWSPVAVGANTATRPLSVKSGSTKRLSRKLERVVTMTVASVIAKDLVRAEQEAFNRWPG